MAITAQEIADTLVASERERKGIAQFSDENPEIPARYRVMAMPTLMLFHRGELIWSVVGARPKAWLLKNLDDALLTTV